jgi:RHS repeat-associated protein
MVQAGQTSPCFDGDFLPYGQEVDFTSTCGSNYRFEGKERDSESGLDNFGARYNSSILGRFMSPDPSGGHLVDPQTLNKYVYVRDNPTSLTDPTGLDLWLKCKRGPNCHGGYVGTWDEAHKHFTRTHIKGDQRENATLGPHGISVKYGGHTYQGVWDTNTGEQHSVAVAGAGALSPFTAEINGNCGGSCVASGTLYEAAGFQMVNGTAAGTLASASDVYSALNVPGSGYVRNRGFDPIDPFHKGVNFRGYSDSDPDLFFSTHVPVPEEDPLNRWNRYIHVDSVYPYDDLVDFFTHGASVVRSLVTPH